MKLNFAFNHFVMRIIRKCNNTNVSLINNLWEIDFWKLGISRSETINNKVLFHWLFQKLSIESEKSTLECPLIFNSKSHILITISFIHQTWYFRIRTFFTALLDKNIDRTVQFVIINFQIGQIDWYNFKATFNQHNDWVLENNAVPLFYGKEIIHITFIISFVWQ